MSMRSNKNVIVMQCDLCKKEVNDNGEQRFGGSVFSGWLTLTSHNGSTCIESLQKQRTHDFCSVDCLRKFLDGYSQY